MKIMRQEVKTVEVVDKVLCNKCGLEIAEDYVQVYHQGGYYAVPPINDGDEFEFHLCEPCLWSFMSTFAISAKMNTEEKEWSVD